ncbi:MAG: type III pantothenate kinase [Verrucomicrobiota bacterium]
MGSTLLININNSFTKAARWQNGKLMLLGRHPTSDLEKVHLFSWQRRAKADQLVVSSVVPRVNNLVKKTPISQQHFIDYRSPLGIKIKFPKPSSIGADRLCNAAGVCCHYTVPAIVIDYGTAVTFDIISPKSEYLGGVIAPGMRVFRDYLSERTALLPRVSLKKPSSAIGKTTRGAMLSGAYYGYQGLVREIVSEIKQELKVKRLAILATGGDSNLFIGNEALFDIHDPDLTFKGMGYVGDQLTR